MIIEVGVAPLKPAEFVIFRIRRKTAPAWSCGPRPGGTPQTLASQRFRPARI
jgi:hypothetical protein